MRAAAMTALAVLLVSVSSLWAQDSTSRRPAPAPSVPIDSGARGEFHRAGAGFACSLPSPPPPNDSGYRPCLHLGRLAIGSEATLADTLLGPPNQSQPQPNGIITHGYFFRPARESSYLVASALNGRIVTLQLTGREPAPGYSFNGVGLGATSVQLQERLGPPISVVATQMAGTELWSYAPWTFSFEVTAGTVTSIRIAAPDV